ncbi:MAG: alpha-glucan family phosphorylase [Deltaproteobacteria bacterium]|nr:alpha-glucan family phosphorylase [Deltaproteobacteria bacterium]
MLRPASYFTDTVAYFSMEVGVDSAIPTYSGGLGVLAGDTLRAAADLGVPMVAVTLLHRKGYFRQSLDDSGNQSESPAIWHMEEVLEPLSARVTVTLEGRAVQVCAWRFIVRGVFGHTVPVYFLDTALAENSSYDQTLTDHLYGGDDHYRLCQEVVLGIGGVEMLCALGHERVQPYHLNEGHAALLTLALLEQQTKERGLAAATESDYEAVRQRCVFTTHTPVPAGHDQFSADLVRRVLGEERTAALVTAQCGLNGTLNMTHLALRFARYVNGVAMRHGEVSRGMFPDAPIDTITNGVHAITWTAFPFRNLYDRRIPEWRRDNFYLRYAVNIPLAEIQYAHAQAKRELLALVAQRTGVQLNPEALTLGFARRAAAYKRGDLLFSDLERLRSIARQVGPLQVIYGGKAHPRDEGGKTLVRRIFAASAQLGTAVPVVYIENYDMALARHICAGVDLWLNTPLRPQEASGTSGMKAALNGVPSLSVLDGWWIEGHVEGVTGWAIGDGQGDGEDHSGETNSLYDKLEHVILPLFYQRPDAFAEVRRSAIALNGSFFNTQRMVFQYLRNAYFGAES